MSSPHKKQEVFIVREDEDTGVWIPSQLSEFLRVYLPTQSLNTMKGKAYIITEFLNFVMDEVRSGKDKDFDILKEKGLYGLTLIHVAKFLNYISRMKENLNGFETVKKKETVLLDFCYYLQNKGVIKGKDSKIEVKLIRRKLANGKESKKADRVIVSPFNEKGSPMFVNFPPKNPTAESGYKRKRKKLEDMSVSVFALFLEFAEEQAPDIALAVYLQCMGGLRCGEVVNLTVEDLKLQYKKDRMFVNIQDRQIELFGSRSSLASQIKYERENQVVFNFNGFLFKVAEKHLSQLSKNLKVKCTTKGNRPLFVNDYGKPMTGENLRDRFNNLRDEFIKYMYGIKASEARELETHSWSTHIGRHLFTNYIIKTGMADNSLGEPDSKIVATLRGDTNINSAMNYISKIAMRDAVDRHVRGMSKLAVDWDELLPQIGKVKEISI